LLAATKQYVRESLIISNNGLGASDGGELSRQLRDLTASFLFRETRRRPMILPMVLEA
jgi:ribonuclease J